MADDVQPMGVGPILGASGACPTIDYAGKVWKVGHPTQKAKGELECLVAACAYENVEKLRGVLPAALFKQKSDELDRQIFGGQQRTWGPLWSAVNSGPDGTPLFLLSLLRQNHEAATMADARGMWRDKNREVNLALAQVIPDFFTLMADDLPVPPEQRAELIATSIAEFLSQLTQPTPIVVSITT